MIDLAPPWDLVALGAALAAIVAVLRVATGDEPVNLAVLFAIPIDQPWPRGVQEEEPAPWRLELLDRLRTADRPGGQPADPARRRSLRPVAAGDPC